LATEAELASSDLTVLLRSLHFVDRFRGTKEVNPVITQEARLCLVNTDLNSLHAALVCFEPVAYSGHSRYFRCDREPQYEQGTDCQPDAWRRNQRHWVHYRDHLALCVRIPPESSERTLRDLISHILLDEHSRSPDDRSWVSRFAASKALRSCAGNLLQRFRGGTMQL
jgi:hypothetical protein